MPTAKQMEKLFDATDELVKVVKEIYPNAGRSSIKLICENAVAICEHLPETDS